MFIKDYTNITESIVTENINADADADAKTGVGVGVGSEGVEKDTAKTSDKVSEKGPDKAKASGSSPSEDSKEASVNENEPATPSPPKLDINKAVSLVSKEQRQPTNLAELANTLRSVGSDIVQAGTVPDVKVPDDIEFPKSKFIDDGPNFDVHNLPNVPIVGDADPSVWSGLEQYTRASNQLLQREKEFSAAKAQTKKKLKRMRV